MKILTPPSHYLHTPGLYKDPTAAAVYFLDGRTNSHVVRSDETIDETMTQVLDLIQPSKFDEPETKAFFADRPLLTHPIMQKHPAPLVMSLSPIEV